MAKIILKGVDYSAPVAANGNDYSLCTTIADVSEKTVDCNGFMLIPGAKITVKFTVTNTADNPTLNVNNTGAKPIYYKGAAISPEMLIENCTYPFRYNGNQYDVIGTIFSGDYNDLENKPQPINDQTPTFTQASTRTNITSGEKLSVLLGKIMKWFADLKSVAFSGSYADLSNTPTIPAAVAVKGNAESAYRTGNVNITPANIGLGNVNNTADANKSVNYANSAGSVAYTNVSGRPTFTLSGTTLYITF